MKMQILINPIFTWTSSRGPREPAEYLVELDRDDQKSLIISDLIIRINTIKFYLICCRARSGGHENIISSKMNNEQ